MPAKKGAKGKKKDPNAPKRASSGYMFYCNAKRDEWKKKNPDAKATEVMKGLGAWWQDATDAEKKPFEKMAEDDKKRYQKEMESYTPAEPSGDESDDSDDGKKRKRKTTKAKKDPNAPKRPKTAFFCYADAVRDKLRKANPDLKMTEISKKIGDQWKGLSDDKKAEYEAEAKELKKKYEKEKAAYDKSKKDASDDEEESGSGSGSDEPAPKKGKKKAESSEDEEESD